MQSTKTTDDFIAAPPPQAPPTRRGANASIGLAELARLLGLPSAREFSDCTERFALTQFRPGEMLYRNGDRLRSLYAVCAGFFKTSVISGGAEQVLAFPMPGDVLGLDGLGEGLHVADTVALDACEVAIIPRANLERLVARSPALTGHLWKLAGREFARQAELITLLGTYGSEVRVAVFLLSLAERFAQRGYSPRWYQLRMTRADIARMLGLTHETVTRVLGRLAAAGWIRVDLKTVEIVDPAALRALAESADAGGQVLRGRRRSAPPTARRGARRAANQVASRASEFAHEEGLT
ncbi:MAG: helix-turn-helix domain-containing protein [Betaproteobacteria bacterium]|nr:helix-turn-helix domain-containing protein [Betaproteobacteria bacterium]